MNLFLDTNALVKLYHVEVGSDRLARLLNEEAGDLVLTVAGGAPVQWRGEGFRSQAASLAASDDLFSYRIGER